MTRQPRRLQSGPCRRGWRTRAWVVLAASATLLCLAQAVPAQPDRTPAADAPAPGTLQAPARPGAAGGAPVVIDGRELFRLRGVSAFPARERARQVRERIRSVARNERLTPGDLRVVEEDYLSVIMAGGTRVLALADADTRAEGLDLPRPLLAEVYRARIAEAMRAFRADREPRVLLVHTGYALAATLALVVGLLVAARILRWTRRVAERHFRQRIGTVEIQGFPLIHAENLWHGLERLLRAAWIVLVVAALYFHLQYVLSLYPWTRGAGQNLLDLVLDPLAVMWTGFVETIPDLVFIAILVLITRYVLKLGGLLFTAVENGAVTIEGFDRSWARPTSRIVRLIIIIFALVMAYPYIPGSDSAAFKGLSILLGVIFSLGSTSVIANVMAGYTMAFRRAFSVGDRISVDELIGDVVEMRVLVTRLRSPKNEELVIPNSVILNSSVINYSSMAASEKLILHTTVGIGYEVPWRQVEAMLIESAERTPGLLHEPPPFILQRALGDFAITYELNVYTDEPDAMFRRYSELHRNILDVFNEYGVQIMTPNYERDPPEPKLVPREQWYAAPARPPAVHGGSEGAS